MSKIARLLPVVGVLTAGVFLLAAARPADDDDKENIEAAKKAAPDVQKLADAAAAGGAALQQQVNAIVKTYGDLEPIMWQMKPRDKAGLGVGQQGAYANDSIELQLLELGGRKPKTAKDIKDHAADWERMADVVKGIAPVTPAYAKKYVKTPADEKAWNGLAGDMGKGADNLIAAIKAGNAAKFKKAVDSINKSCNDCHTKFRDNDPPDPAADVARLADLVDKPDEFKKQANEVAFMNDHFQPIKKLLGPVKKGGMQIGPFARIDGFELELLRLAEQPPTAEQLAQRGADWRRMGEVLCAMAEVTPFYLPPDVKSPGRHKRWNDFAGDMGDAARELIKVVKANDAKNVGAVAVRLARSCSDCHEHFRDGGRGALPDVVQAAAAVDKPDQLKAQAQELRRCWSLDEISCALKPRDKGGLTPAGIEGELLDLELHPPTADDLPALAPTLEQAASMVRTVAEATPDYGKEYTAKDGASYKWDSFADDMRRGADDLTAAVKARDVSGVRKAITVLNKSCADCHKTYR